MNSPKDLFIEIRDEYFRPLSSVMFGTVNAYYLWQALKFAISIPEVGEEKANRNVKIMSEYKYFFSTAEYASLDTAIIGLMKFFDKNPRALSLASLHKKMYECKDIITADTLLEVYPDRFHDDDIRGKYSIYKQEDVDHLDEFRNKNELVIKTLKDIRDTRLAHRDIKPSSSTFIPIEVEALIKEVQDAFNKLSATFESSTTLWDHLEERVNDDVQYVLDNLERGEVQRLDEIEKRWSTSKD
jgi:hypothetical protein